MKGIDIFCASQAATSIRLSMEESGGSTSTTTATYLGGNTSGRALDRYNPIIRDATRITKVLLNTTGPPCSSSNQPPISPKPLHHPRHQKNCRKNPSKENNSHRHHQNKKIISSKQNDDSSKKKSFSSSWSCTKPGEFISPPGSSRYLLTTQKSSFLSDHFDPLLPIVPVGPHSTAPDQDKKVDIVVVDDDDDSSSSANTSKPSNSSSSSSSSSADQVVVLRVSLHCRGCERKLKKHLTRMEGVTSFKIDFAAKKLTVVGDVTPLSVLASVSKVKNAQLLTSNPLGLLGN